MEQTQTVPSQGALNAANPERGGPMKPIGTLLRDAVPQGKDALGESLTNPPDKKNGPLYAKLAKILGAVGRVEKRGRNEYHNYDYVMEADLANHIRPLLSEHGIGIVFGAEELKELSCGVLAVKCRIRIGDSEGNVIETTVWGTGKDRNSKGEDGDKALYKAMTGAVKYWLCKNFLVTTGDDPENDTDEKQQARQERRPPRTNGPVTNQPSKSTTAQVTTGPTAHCEGCGAEMKFIQAGVSKIKKDKDGKPKAYGAFWKCDDCSKTLRDADFQKQLQQRAQIRAPLATTPPSDSDRPVITDEDIPF